MSAFQDFGYLSERRRAERQQKRRKRLMIAGATVAIILVLAIVGAAAVHYNSNRSGSTSTSSDLSTSSRTHSRSPRSSSSSKSAGNSSDASSSDGLADKKEGSASTAYEVICAPTDYSSVCESSLKKRANANSSPKELVRAAVATVVDEVDAVFKKSDDIQSDDPAVKGAVEVCKQVHKYAVDDLNRTLSTIDENNLSQLSKKVPEMKNWLSAVVANQQTCIDGFPDGEIKTKMQTAMNSAKQLSSNALAIVGSMSSFMSLLRVGGGSSRRLFASPQPAQPAIGKDGIPSWVSDADRRILLSKAGKQFTPNVTVAKDGSGDFKTINEALAKLPAKYDGRYVIYVKGGVYKEQVVIDQNMINITMFGDGSRKTIVTGSKNFVDGVKTFQTATFAAIGDGFMAMAIGFVNSAGPEKHQAVALRVQSDRSIFLNCRMEGYQDTLYAHTHRHFYRGCLILGTVDFIFGDSAAVFQNCILTVRRPLDNQQNIVLAQGRTDRHESTGFVIHNCKIVPDDALVPDVAKIKSYLGRPWKEYSHTVVMESEIGDLIQPDGYMPWEGDFALKTLSYNEYSNKGGGADTSKRVKWPGVKVIGLQEALTYTVEVFIQGGEWISNTNAPVRLGLFG